MPTRDTPARRTRARARAAVMLPPPAPRAKGPADASVVLTAAGRRFRVDVEGDPQVEAAIDAAESVTIAVRDPAGDLLKALGTEEELQARAVTVDLDGVTYALRSTSDDGTGLVSLAFEDQVKWRMGLRRRYLAKRRSREMTFARFALLLVEEASAPPLEPIRAFIPELSDPSMIARRARPRGVPARGRGTAGAANIKVKGKAANVAQLRRVDEALSAAADLGASRRVMVAVIMCATQESRMGADMELTGNDDVGFMQQGREWIGATQSRQAGPATQAFLTGKGPGATGNGSGRGWKQVHGSLKTVRGSLDAAITAVQGSIGGYGQWQDEATHTVDEWLAAGGSSGTLQVAEPYEYTRGEKGGRSETSWDAIGRYAEPLRYRRWAQGNAFYLASDEELRAAAPSVSIEGGEPWLLSFPAVSEWGAGRETTELSIRVLAARWGVMIGAVVRIAVGDARDGRYLVVGRRGGRSSPELEVTLRRPQERAPEPAADLRSVSSAESAVVLAGGGDTRAVARAISARRYPYVWGGGHGKVGTPSGGPPVGYDCSGATCAFLGALGHGFRIGGTPTTSGGLMSWGEAGTGKVYTVWANPVHVFVEFADGSRFDTSQHAESGPRLVGDKRSTAGFTPRHWKGF